jgi:hypothetical protein
VEDAIQHLQTNAIQKFGLKPEKQRKKFWWLLERDN